MERVVDEITVYAICIALMVWKFSSTWSAVGALACVVVVLSVTLIPVAWARYAIEIVGLAACAGMSVLQPFLPAMTYLCMTESAWTMRLSWMIAWLAGLALSGTSEFSAVLLLGCGIASILAVRTNRLVAERLGMRSARDGMREQYLELAARNRALAAKLNTTSENEKKLQEDEEKLARFDGLTDRERTIVTLIAQGLDNREIARQLYLSEGTIRNNISAILQKKGLKNRTQIAVMYYCT